MKIYDLNMVKIYYPRIARTKNLVWIKKKREASGGILSVILLEFNVYQYRFGLIPPEIKLLRLVWT